MTNELLPCPFCGGTQDENGVIDHDESCFVYQLIDMFMYGSGSKKKIEKAWNTRADDQSQAAAYWRRAYEETVRTCRIVKASRKYVLSDGTELFEDGCSECNSYLGDGDNYCSNCGAKVVD